MKLLVDFSSKLEKYTEPNSPYGFNKLFSLSVKLYLYLIIPVRCWTWEFTPLQIKI